MKKNDLKKIDEFHRHPLLDCKRILSYKKLSNQIANNRETCKTIRIMGLSLRMQQTGKEMI